MSRYTLWPIQPVRGISDDAREMREQFEDGHPSCAVLGPEMDRLIVQGDYTLWQAYQMAEWEREHEAAP
jgi:hypothetical protein